MRVEAEAWIDRDIGSRRDAGDLCDNYSKDYGFH